MCLLAIELLKLQEFSFQLPKLINLLATNIFAVEFAAVDFFSFSGSYRAVHFVDLALFWLVIQIVIIIIQSQIVMSSLSHEDFLNIRNESSQKVNWSEKKPPKYCQKKLKPNTNSSELLWSSFSPG